MALKVNATTPTFLLHRSFFTPQTPYLPPIKPYHRNHTHIRLRCRSSLLDEQRKEAVSFSEPENSLIQALIGVQGRGRSVSSQQLTVMFLPTYSSFRNVYFSSHSEFELLSVY